MATNRIGTVALMLTANAQGVATGVSQAQKAIAGIGTFANRAFSVFTGNLMARGFSTAIEGAKELAKWAAETAMEYEQAEIAFQVMTGSKAGGTKLLNELQTLAVETPFKSSEVVAQAKLLKAYGVETEDLIKTISQLGDVAAGTGVDINRLGLAYGQVISKGRFQASELRQFTEAGAGVAMFAKAANMSSTQFLAAMEAGKIGSDIVVKAFEQATQKGGMFFRLMEKQSQTVKGRFDSFIESFEILIGKVGLAAFKAFGIADLFNSLAKLVQGADTAAIGSWINKAADGLSPLATGMEAIVAAGREYAKLLAAQASSWEDIRTALDGFVKEAGPAIVNLTAEIATLVAELENAVELLNRVSGGGLTGKGIGDKMAAVRFATYGPAKDIFDAAFGRGDDVASIDKARQKALFAMKRVFAKPPAEFDSGAAWDKIFDELDEDASAAARIAGEKFEKAFLAGAEGLAPGFKKVLDGMSMDMASPGDVLQQTMNAVSLAEMTKRMSEDVADRMRVSAFDAFKKSTGAGGAIRNTAPLIESNSQAAMSALNAAKGIGASSVEDILREGNERSKQALEVQKEISRDLKKNFKPAPALSLFAASFTGV